MMMMIKSTTTTTTKKKRKRKSAAHFLTKSKIQTTIRGQKEVYFRELNMCLMCHLFRLIYNTQTDIFYFHNDFFFFFFCCQCTRAIGNFVTCDTEKLARKQKPQNIITHYHHYQLSHIHNLTT